MVNWSAISLPFIISFLLGVDTITLYPIKGAFKQVYCFANSTSKDMKSCEFLMMDEKANVFMKIHGLKVGKKQALIIFK